MPLYFFNLRDATGLVRDPEGTHLPDESTAREHGRIVAGELMRHRELNSRGLRLEVCDGEHRPCFDLLFVEADPQVKQLPPELQSCIVQGWTQSASLRDTIQDLELTVLQVRATLARSDNVPYLAAINGRRV